MRDYLVGGVAAAVLIAGALVLVWFYGEAQYREGRADTEVERLLTELEGFRLEAGRITGLSNALETSLETLRAVKPQIVKEYHHETILRPLPVECKFDAGRLYVTSTAIDAANAARQSGYALPAHPAAAN